MQWENGASRLARRRIAASLPSEQSVASVRHWEVKCSKVKSALGDDTGQPPNMQSLLWGFFSVFF